MKTILDSRRYHYMTRVGIFCIVVALIAGFAGCGGDGGDGGEPYTLTISSTEGGSVTTPGEGIFYYDEGEVVNLEAIPDAGYRFVEWTGDVDTIDDVDDARISIIMNGDQSVTATFEVEPVDYYFLTVAVNGCGSTSPSAGQHTYAAGTPVSITATPYSCCLFASWTGDVGTIADINAALTTITMNGDYSITANFEFEEEAVAFADPNLEAAVREAIAIPQGPIYPSDLDGLTFLNASFRNIINVSGLECATSLTWLDSQGNQISDISPLANLTNLEHLHLSDNEISDISPLADHTSLTVLYLSSNQISEIAPLANLTGLTYLHLAHNQISDVSPLASLTNIASLNLGDNQISDISTLANLTKLSGLWLYENQISDISPLVDNQGLSEGDEVHVWGNPLSSDSINIYIPQLQARGVIVDY